MFTSSLSFMDRRRSFQFIGTGTAALILGRRIFAEQPAATRSHWVWIRPNQQASDAVLTDRFRMFKSYGIHGVFIEGYHERFFRLAHQAGLSTHLWMWTLNRGDQWIRENHPEWYAVNRKGESCADHPPYVDYYRWLGPNRPEVGDYLAQTVREHLKKPYVQGIHLDYVRFCDVILPVELWPNYKLVQTAELPEFDYCYCETCRTAYREQTGKDPLDIPYPSDQFSWKKFRYDAVTKLVNRLADLVHQQRKTITAAVFPTPEIAKRLVRQDWVRWKLDAVCPMVYHNFYLEPESWIGEAVEQGVYELNGRRPLYAGLYLPAFQEINQFRTGVSLALQQGAKGVSLFGDVTEDHLRVLQSIPAH